MKKRKETSESQLSEMSKRKETAESKCSKLEATNVSLTQETEQARALKKSFQDARVDLISAGGEAFERSKAQALWIMLYLDMSKMDFFMVVVDGKLVDMEEASPETEGLKDVVMGDSKLGTLENEHHEVKKVYGCCWPSVVMCLLYLLNNILSFCQTFNPFKGLF